MKKLLTLSIVLPLLAAIACGESGASEEEILASLADLIIVPGYERVAAESQEMRAALEALCANPSDAAAMDGARREWRELREAWTRSQSTWFGPVMDRRSVGLIDWSPVEPERIETLLAERPNLTENEVSYTLSSSQRGMGAVEYLIFGDDAADALASAPARCGYVVTLGRVIERETAGILEEWTVEREEGGAYSGFFTGRADSSLLTKTAVAELVRTQVFLMRTIVDMRLASALGLREGGADLSALPGGLGRNALADLRQQTLGLRDMYEGHASEGALGISDLARPISKDTDDRMRARFAAAVAAIDGVEGPLKAAIVERPEQTRAVYDRLSELQLTLETELVSHLSVAVGFSDTDGDSLR